MALTPSQMENYQQKLARLVVRSGVNVQPGQLVVLNTSTDAIDMARRVTQEAYAAGAREVIVNITDPAISRMTYLQAHEEVFQEAPSWRAQFLNETSEKGAAYITLLDEDPDALRGVDPNRLSSRSLAMHEKTGTYHTNMMNGTSAWSVIAVPSPAWAKKVYPQLSEEEAMAALWEDIFAISRIDENDPQENWKAHNNSFFSRTSRLNAWQFDRLHYQNKAGTDLWVKMPENHQFSGGGMTLKNGVFTFPNIPTEEIFCAPKWDGVDGILVSTMPLNLNGSLVKDIVFRFENGKIVEASASEGLDLLEAQIQMDEGASYLGEIALVPYGSPIQQRNRIFYNTLIDENASCHFAFGQAYPECIPGGQNMSKEEQKARGLNQSANHVDFMVGSEDLQITGYTKDGQAVPIFKDGRFAPEFDAPSALPVK